MKHPSVLIPSKFPTQQRPRKGFDYKDVNGYDENIFENEKVKQDINKEINDRITTRLSQKQPLNWVSLIILFFALITSFILFGSIFLT